MADVKLKDARGNIYSYTGVHEISVPSTTDGTKVTFSDEGIVPTGNIDISMVGTTDVTNYATATILDADLIPSNIKADVNILGVTGSFTGTQKPEETFTVYPTTSVQTITPTSGSVFSQGAVSSIYTDVMTAAEMDANLVAANNGRMFRYVGTSTDTYKTNHLYLVNETPSN